MVLNWSVPVPFIIHAINEFAEFHHGSHSVSPANGNIIDYELFTAPTVFPTVPDE